MRAWPVVALVVLAGCAEAPPHPEIVSPTDDRLPRDPVAFRTILHERHSSVFEHNFARELDIHQWNETWDRYATARDPWPPKPFVDFANETLIIVPMGPGSNGCEDIRVVAVEREGADGLAVRAEAFRGDAPGILCSGERVWPVHIVATEAVGRVVRSSIAPVPAGFSWDVELGAPGPAPEAEPLAPLGPFDFRTLARGDDTAITTQGYQTIGDQARWSELWAAHTAHMATPPPLPEVDFTRERVLAKVGLFRSGACVDVEIVRMDVAESFVVVRMRADPPPPGVECRDLFPRHYHFVTFPITSKGILREEADPR